MAVKITEKDEAFIKALEETVAEYGRDYVYPEDKKIKYANTNMCLYFDQEDPEKPLCFIGVALSKLGFTNDDMSYTAGASLVLRELGFSSLVAEAARTAQYEQDKGQTWGQAYDAFKKELNIK